MSGYDHLHFLKRAVRLSAENVSKAKGGPFGAVVVKDGKLIASGSNLVTSLNDPTAHAEVVAIRKASAKLKTFDLSGCILYSSCEPCPMCLSAAYWARVDAIYFANSREQAAAIGFSDKEIYDEVAKPLTERSIQIQQLPLPEALEVFEHWQISVSKIVY